jgi:hypothetical protein
MEPDSIHFRIRPVTTSPPFTRRQHMRLRLSRACFTRCLIFKLRPSHGPKRFSKLMLTDIAAAWQKADVEQRVGVQNFLFHDGIAYNKANKFLNTDKPSLFQQLRSIVCCQNEVGVPDGI